MGETQNAKFRAKIMIIFAVALFCSIPVMGMTDFLKTQPDVTPFGLTSEYGRQTWNEYFQWWHWRQISVSATPPVGWFLRALRDEPSPDSLVKTLDVLEGRRRDLPMELRWILAAVEIATNHTQPETIDDARSALRSTSFEHTFNIFDPKVRPALSYRVSGSYEYNFRELHLDSQRDLIYLYRFWQQWPALAPQVSTDTALDESRIGWLRELTALVGAPLTAPELLELLEELNKPENLRFSTPELRKEFLGAGEYLLSSLQHRYGYYSYRSDDVAFIPKNEETYKKEYVPIRDLYRSWMNSDLEFIVKRFGSLKSDQLISIEDLINRKLTDADGDDLEKSLKSNDISLDSYFLAALLWSKYNAERRPPAKELPEGQSAMEILFDSQIQDKVVRIERKGLRSEYLPYRDFDSFLKAFYSVVRIPGALDTKTALLLLDRQTPRTPNMKDPEWLELERQRFQSAGNNLPPETFKAKLVEKVFGVKSTSDNERILAAEFLKALSTTEEIEAVALQLKSRVQGVNPKNYKGVDFEIWGRDDGRLAKIVTALSPRDPDLGSYLAKIYVESRLDGIGGQAARDLMEKIGVAPVQVKDDLLRRLRFVGAGDSSGNFQALLRLFPQEGQSIVEILYLHRRAPEKLKPMILALVEAAKKNPEILDSVRQGVRDEPDKKISRALYQGVPLDEWLQAKLPAKPKESCEVLLKAAGGPAAPSEGTHEE